MRDPYSLENKTILITGASSGIGRSTAIIASQQGAAVILVGRDKTKLNDTLSRMETPMRHRIEVFDLNQVDMVAEWLKSITRDMGSQINGIAHFAGVHEIMPVRLLQKKNIEQIMNINLYSALAIMKASANKLVFAPGGSIVLTASVVGQVGQAGVVTYSASKGAVIAAAKSAALEFAKSRIRVNAVVPGMVRSEMLEGIIDNISQPHYERIESYHPLGIGQPEDVAYSVIYLLSDASKWVTGTAMVVDGGYTCH